MATYDKPQTPKDALILALRLAITTPTEQGYREVAEMLPALAADLTEHEIEECKAIAKIQVFDPTD